MKSAKVPALLAASLATAVLGTGLAALAASDDDSPLHKLMEKVQANNATILKSVRTAVNYKKSQADVETSAKELVKLAKDARVFTEPATAQKLPQSKWEELCDEMMKEAEKFAELAANKDSTHTEAKSGYRNVQKACTNCHDVFRVEEDP